MTYTYEALDRIHCIINNIQVNLVEHCFYDENEDYRKLVDSAIESLADAYQLAGKAWDVEESNGDK